MEDIMDHQGLFYKHVFKMEGFIALPKNIQLLYFKLLSEVQFDHYDPTCDDEYCQANVLYDWYFYLEKYDAKYDDILKLEELHLVKRVSHGRLVFEI